jgi:hypothetical protein
MEISVSVLLRSGRPNDVSRSLTIARRPRLHSSICGDSLSDLASRVSHIQQMIESHPPSPQQQTVLTMCKVKN